jgi:heme/copper-type cytochrome/quinol oxidase subunit 1
MDCWTGKKVTLRLALLTLSMVMELGIKFWPQIVIKRTPDNQMLNSPLNSYCQFDIAKLVPN